MRRLVLLITLCLVTSLGLRAQFSNEVWHEGFLVTTEDDTLKGLIKYDMESNIVQLIINKSKVQTFSSHKIFYFEIFDKVVKNYRQFYSIPYEVNYNYTIPIIFEVLYEAPLSLLAREAVVQENVPNSSVYWSGSVLQDKMMQTFYFLDKKGNIQMFTGKRSDLLTIMARKSSDVKNFIKKNNPKTDQVRDLIRITAFYNSI